MDGYNMPITTTRTQARAMIPETPQAMRTLFEKTTYTITVTTTMSAETRIATIPGPMTTTTVCLVEKVTETSVVTTTVSAASATSVCTTKTLFEVSTQTVTATVERAAETCIPNTPYRNTLQSISYDYRFFFELCGIVAILLCAGSFYWDTQRSRRAKSPSKSSGDRRTTDNTNPSLHAKADDANPGPRVAYNAHGGRHESSAIPSTGSHGAGIDNANAGTSSRSVDADSTPRAPEDTNSRSSESAGRGRGRRGGHRGGSGNASARGCTRADNASAGTSSRADEAHPSRRKPDSANSRGSESVGGGQARRKDISDTEGSEWSTPVEDSDNGDIIADSDLDARDFAKGVRADYQTMEDLDVSDDEEDLPGKFAGNGMGKEDPAVKGGATKGKAATEVQGEQAMPEDGEKGSKETPEPTPNLKKTANDTASAAG
jgi:hypothetical protein